MFDIYLSFGVAVQDFYELKERRTNILLKTLPCGTTWASKNLKLDKNKVSKFCHFSSLHQLLLK